MIQHLKENIELKFGRKITYQKDCKDLSECIMNNTSQLLSPSTLRRFFGFLATNSNPSRVTLDILSNYCSYSSWEDFKIQNSHETQYPDPILSIWETAKQKAKIISRKNVRQLEKKSVTKLLVDVQRGFINERFTNLFQSNLKALPIIAPAGYGKTALLLNWYSEYQRIANNCNDIVLLIPASFLENWIGKDLFFENWLLTLLDIPSSALFDRIKEKPETAPGKFILLIDALDEITTSISKYEKLFRAIDLFVVNLPNQNFKVIVTSRYPEWLQFTKVSASIDSWCCNAFNLFNRDGANIPKLTPKEIQQVLDATINRKERTRLIIEQLPHSLQQELNYPYALKLFIDNHLVPNNKSISDRNDLITEFIKDQVYQEQFSDEKVDILNAIVAISHKDKLAGIVKKNDIKALYPIHLKLSGNYFIAYNQLLSFGILGEELIENEYGLYTNKVYIAYKPLFEYLLVQKLIDENGGINIELFKLIEKYYKDSELLGRLIVLLYSLSYKMRLTPVLKQFFCLSDYTLKQVFENNEILQIINSNEQVQNELISHYAAEPKARKYLFEQYNDLNSIARASHILPNNYLKHSKEETEQHYAKILLALSDAYRLDFKWTPDFIQETKNSIPNTGFNAFTKGAWFSCILMASYIDKSISLNDVVNKINSYTSVQFTNGDKTRAVFELGLVLGIIFSKQFKQGYMRLEEFLGDRLDNPQTAEENALAIYCMYLKWKVHGEFDPDLKQKIEGCLTKVPDWIQLQTVIIAKSFMSIYSFTIGEMETAFSLYRNAIELSNFAGYKVFEIKLLNELAATLTTIGEHENAEKCSQFVQSIAESCNFDFSLI